MKRKAIVVLSIIVATGLLMGFLAGGCAGSRSPEGVVKNCWKALQKGDIERALTYMAENHRVKFEEDLDNKGLPVELSRDFVKAVTGAMSLSVTGETIDGDRAVVYVNVTEPDPGELIDLFWEKMLEFAFDEEYDKDEITRIDAMMIYIEVLDDVETKVTGELQIPLILEDDSWKIDGNVIPDFEIRLNQ